MTDTSTTTTAADATTAAATTTTAVAATPVAKFAVGDVVTRKFHSFPNGEVTQAALVCQVFPDQGSGFRYALAPLPGQTGPVAESELAAL